MLLTSIRLNNSILSQPKMCSLFSAVPLSILPIGDLILMNKNTTINLRISADDKAELQRRAKEMKLSLSTFLVLRGLGYV